MAAKKILARASELRWHANSIPFRKRPHITSTVDGFLGIFMEACCLCFFWGGEGERAGHLFPCRTVLVGTQISGPCARYSICTVVQNFLLWKRGHRHAKRYPLRDKEKKKERRGRTLLGEATPTSYHMVQLSEFPRQISFLRALPPVENIGYRCGSLSPGILGAPPMLLAFFPVSFMIQIEVANDATASPEMLDGSVLVGRGCIECRHVQTPQSVSI